MKIRVIFGNRRWSRLLGCRSRGIASLDADSSARRFLFEEEASGDLPPLRCLQACLC